MPLNVWIAGIAKRNRFMIAQQMSLGHVFHVRRCNQYHMHDARLGIDAVMRFHVIGSLSDDGIEVEDE